ncbi:MAG: hypothetical protein B7Z13_05760 [Caulobacterales bacterium 32-67-6]|nr:MAG: hypothetical protein B7Z13_05760 [Caulobacterales bacterium 32-67-6]
MQSRYVLGGGYLLAAVLTAVAILLAASPPEAGPLRPASNAILTVLSLNLVLILVLAALVGFRLLALLDARSVDAGARLHLRFVTLFALAAVAPAVVVALFYGVLAGLEDHRDTPPVGLLRVPADASPERVAAAAAACAQAMGRRLGPLPRQA